MQVTVYQDGTAIGTAILEHLDPPMGVAMGPFSPSDQYDRDRHADFIEGYYVGDKSQALSAHADRLGALKTTAVSIEDWADPEIGTQLTVWFQDGENFEALFSTHQEYKAYYAR